MRRALALLLLALLTPASASGQAVTFQADPAHTGYAHDPRVAPPLRQAWARSFPGKVSYPVIAEGKVFVTTRLDEKIPNVTLLALSARDGRTVWSRDLGPTTYVAHAAYDAGRVYVTLHGSHPDEPALLAFSAATGAPLWDVKGGSPAGPPVATGGDVYFMVSSGVAAYRGSDGAFLWIAHSSSSGAGAPAVTGDMVFGTMGCGDVLARRRGDGAEVWRPDVGGCTGGGGSTPVFHGGRLYSREGRGFPKGNVFDAATGAVLGPLRADYAPAFGGGLGLFPDAQLPGEQIDFGYGLTARTADGRVRWRFRGDGYLDTAPLIVDRTVYVGSGGGRLYGVSLARGRVVWRADLGRPIPSSSEGGLISGMAAGEGILVVPAWRRLVAYRR
jgi:outer membrane protein assembly factor BamB